MTDPPPPPPPVEESKRKDKKENEEYEDDDDDDDDAAVPRRSIVYLHLNLGIGGAERLVLNLALASLAVGDEVKIYSTVCSPHHCFQEVKHPDGVLADRVEVVGSWIPSSLGGATALCSTLRMLYLAWYCSFQKDVDVVVVDVLPTCIPFLMCWWKAPAVLYYCHFPDKLLASLGTRGGIRQGLRRAYRWVMDGLEEYCVRFSDLIVVNSNFTKQETLQAFPSLQGQQSSCTVLVEYEQDDDDENDDYDKNKNQSDYMQVLYPAIDFTQFVGPSQDEDEDNDKNTSTTPPPPIVSLNRFERKKNVGLLLEAYALFCQEEKAKKTADTLPRLVIAGGYDVDNVENVQHLQELKDLAHQLQITSQTDFLPSISDETKARLLRQALCVAYTPDREHFGIVPVEAMYAGTPVVAVRSGGPRETVVEGVSGWLVEPTAAAFGHALQTVWHLSPAQRRTMSRAAHAHVVQTFGWELFCQKWNACVQQAARRGHYRRALWQMNEDEDIDGPDGGTALQAQRLKRIFPLWVDFVRDLLLVLAVACLLRQVWLFAV